METASLLCQGHVPIVTAVNSFGEQLVGSGAGQNYAGIGVDKRQLGRGERPSNVNGVLIYAC